MTRKSNNLPPQTIVFCDTGTLSPSFRQAEVQLKAEHGINIRDYVAVVNTPNSKSSSGTDKAVSLMLEHPGHIDTIISCPYHMNSVAEGLRHAGRPDAFPSTAILVPTGSEKSYYPHNVLPHLQGRTMQVIEHPDPDQLLQPLTDAIVQQVLGAHEKAQHAAEQNNHHGFHVPEALQNLWHLFEQTLGLSSRRDPQQDASPPR